MRTLQIEPKYIIFNTRTFENGKPFGRLRTKGDKMYSEESLRTCLWDLKASLLRAIEVRAANFLFTDNKVLQETLFQETDRIFKDWNGRGRVIVRNSKRPIRNGSGMLVYICSKFGKDDDIALGSSVGIATFSRCLPSFHDTTRAALIFLDADVLITACLLPNGRYEISKNGEKVSHLRLQDFPFGDCSQDPRETNLNFILDNLRAMSM